MKFCLGFAAQVLLAAALATSGLAIVNGQLESGYAATGILDDGAGHTATGVLIDSYWVLTAASFASAADSGTFHLGFDAAVPEASHVISAFFPHFSYYPETGDHDIALVRLATPVASVTPIPYLTNGSALTAGETVTFVGFGWASLEDPSNTQRRSCDATVEVMQFLRFVTYGASAGPYIGDVGGPALFMSGGTTYVAGIVSSITEGSYEYTAATRVSSYAAYIADVMATNPPVSGVATAPPAQMALRAVPNPFNPATEIVFELEKPARCRLRVLDPRGRVVAELADRVFGSGGHTVTWYGRTANGQAAPSGVYVIELQSQQRTWSRKVVLAR